MQLYAQVSGVIKHSGLNRDTANKVVLNYYVCKIAHQGCLGKFQNICPKSLDLIVFEFSGWIIIKKVYVIPK